MLELNLVLALEVEKMCIKVALQGSSAAFTSDICGKSPFQILKD